MFQGEVSDPLGFGGTGGEQGGGRGLRRAARVVLSDGLDEELALNVRVRQRLIYREKQMCVQVNVVNAFFSWTTKAQTMHSSMA